MKKLYFLRMLGFFYALGTLSVEANSPARVKSTSCGGPYYSITNPSLTQWTSCMEKIYGPLNCTPASAWAPTDSPPWIWNCMGAQFKASRSHHSEASPHTKRNNF